MANTVRVRAETPVLGAQVGYSYEVERTPLLEAAIADGRFTVLADTAGGDGQLRGAALDDALRAHGLRIRGTADSKRRQLAKHIAAEHPDDPTAVEHPSAPSGADGAGAAGTSTPVGPDLPDA